MSKPLPDQASLGHLKNEAKALLKAHRRKNPSVCATLRQLANLREATDAEILAADIPLQKVQHALARDYGFPDWKALTDDVNECAAYSAKLKEAYDVFTAKGPSHGSTGSPHEQRQREMYKKLHQAGDEGMRVMKKLACSCNGRARFAAALFFGTSGHVRARDELTVLLDDPASKVRHRALRFYASQIHPDRSPGKLPWHWERAHEIPGGVEVILPLTQDDNAKIQMEAITALSAYAGLDDARIGLALRRALDDPLHKVQHAAARALSVQCPGCGKVPESFQARGVS